MTSPELIELALRRVASQLDCNGFETQDHISEALRKVANEIQKLISARHRRETDNHGATLNETLGSDGQS